MQLGKALKENKEEQAKAQTLQASLGQYERENQQMKDQFDAAVKLMEAKSTEQTLELARLRQELGHAEARGTSLREKLAGETRKCSELGEKVTKITADYKISSDRCRLLEQEKHAVEERAAQLSSELGHLRQTLAGERNFISTCTGNMFISYRTTHSF